MRKTVEGWRTAWKNRLFRDQFLVAAVALPVAALGMRLYVEQIEMHAGITFVDPFPSMLEPIDFNWVIFAVLYSGLLFGLVSLSLHPFRLLLTMRALVLLILLRIVCLFVFPLGSMEGAIPLSDPILQFSPMRFTGHHGLFFCWEVATLALLSATSRWRDLRMIFAGASVLLAVLLLLQRAQYSVSIVSAPAFAYAAFGVARYFTVGDVREVGENARNAQMTVAIGKN